MIVEKEAVGDNGRIYDANKIETLRMLKNALLSTDLIMKLPFFMMFSLHLDKTTRVHDSL